MQTTRSAPTRREDPVEAFGLLLHAVAKSWREELDRRLKPLGLTRVQWRALLWLDRAGGEISQSELAGLLEIGAPATVALVDRMERDGLVARRAVQGDRRRNAVLVTARARRLLTRIRRRVQELRGEVRRAIPAAELAEVSTLLRRMREHIESLTR